MCRLQCRSRYRSAIVLIFVVKNILEFVEIWVILFQNVNFILKNRKHTVVVQLSVYSCFYSFLRIPTDIVVT